MENTKTYNTESFSGGDFKAARESWRRDLCGDSESNSLSVKGMEALLRMRDEDSEALRREMNRNTDALKLFGVGAPVNSGELKLQYDRLLRMALPFGTVGCRSYRSPELLSDVLYGLELLYDKMYGENVVTDTSFRSWKDFDWWDWYVGAACPLMDVLMIIEDDVTPDKIAKFITPVVFLSDKMRTAPTAAEAMSRIVTLTPLALINCDRPLLQKLYAECEMLLEEHDGGDNMRRDFCCMTHGLPYNVSYGVINLSRIGKVVQILGRSPLSYPLKNMDNLKGMLRYTFAPVLYRGRTLAPMNGRAMQYDNCGASILRELHYLYGLFGEEFDGEISRLIHRNGSSEVRDQLISSYDGDMTLEKYRRINSIPDTRAAEMPKTHIGSYARFYDALNNEKYAVTTPDSAYFWYSGDIGVQHRHGSMIGLRMPSVRSLGYECMNGAGGDGWYTGEGALYLYTPTGEDEFSPKWWSHADKHLIPGTTVDERQREIMFFNQAWRTSQNFVGGVSLCGEFLTASMNYEAFHNEVDEGRPDMGYGRSLPVYKCTLTAKKSWFFFEKAIVAIGCDVSAHDGYAVRTVVENRIFEGENVVADGVTIPYFEGERHLAAKKVYIPHAGGYIFPEGGDLVLRFYENEGVRFLSLYVHHGKDPQGAKYAYVLIPNASLDEALAYDINDIEILRNDGEIQAAKEISSGLCGVIFRTSGEICGVNAHHGMIAMLKEGEGGDVQALTVSDPTQGRKNLSFEVSGKSFLIETDSARGRGYEII